MGDSDRRRGRRVGALLLLAVGVLLALPLPAQAHADLRSSDPAAASTIYVAPAAVTLVFGATRTDSARLDGARLDAARPDAVRGDASRGDGSRRRAPQPKTLA